jgi:1,4-alpha-glucan branching enzyme
MFGQPGKKLLFMGGEFGQRSEWDHDSSLEWHVLAYSSHHQLQRLVGDLNHLYRTEPALHQLDTKPEGMRWVVGNDSEQSVVAFFRQAEGDGAILLCTYNFTPIPRHNYLIGVPRDGRWAEILNTDADHYGGSGQGNLGGVDAAPIPSHGYLHSVSVTIPPLGGVFLKSEVASTDDELEERAPNSTVERDTPGPEEPATFVTVRIAPDKS